MRNFEAQEHTAKLELLEFESSQITGVRRASREFPARHVNDGTHVRALKSAGGVCGS